MSTTKNTTWWFLLTLILISMAGLVGSDVYLPMLPTIGVSLNKNIHAMQATLSVYLFGLAAGQLVVGVATEYFGRKRLLIGLMALYALSSLSCAFSFSYEQLLISRLLQAFGACSGLVLGRAIIGDLYTKQEAGKIFSTIFPFVGMSPAISPVVGGIIGTALGWRVTFVFIMLFAVAALVLVAIHIPETLKQKKTERFKVKHMLQAYSRFLSSRLFWMYALCPCFSYFAYFSYISQSPFIFHAHGLSDFTIGWLYITLALTYVVGNLMNKRMLHRMSLDRVLRFGFAFFVIGAVGMLAFSLHAISLIAMVLFISILTLGNGFLIPLGSAGVIGSFKVDLGYASGLLGFFQLGMAALASFAVGILTHNSILRLSVYLSVVTVLAWLLFFIFSIKHESDDAI